MPRPAPVVRRALAAGLWLSALTGLCPGTPDRDPAGSPATETSARADDGPLLFDLAAWERARTGLGHDNPALAAMIEEADQALGQRPVSVTDKPEPPPGTNPHDYASAGPYWWPDPSKPDGLPYVRRDGVPNPDAVIDREAWRDLNAAVRALVPAWFFTGDERYARHAALLLRHWFLDPETAMNPNLDFAQGVPGRMRGRGIGTIDWSPHLPLLLSHVHMLAGSDAWTDQDQRAFLRWMERFHDWLQESPRARQARGTANNIGTWFDLMEASVAVYTGHADRAREVLETVPERRFASQIEPDGSQPHELNRTLSRTYTAMNLRGFLLLAMLGERVGVDLHSFDSPDDPRARLQAAVAWVVPFAKGDAEWRWRQIARDDLDMFIEPLRLAAILFDEPAYEKPIQLVAGERHASLPLNLIHPPVVLVDGDESVNR